MAKKVKKSDLFDLLPIRDKNCPWDVPQKQLYKIYNDGGHYVARIVKGKKKRYSYQQNKMNYYFDNIYFDGLNKNLSKEQLVEYIKNELLSIFPNEQNIDEYIADRLKQKSKNFFSRIKRFKRKANLNMWNYFVTITYDNKKHSADTFKTKLRKCLSNLHSRYGWKYMGVFELSPEKERLHFHAIMYIPDGNMIGQIDEIKDYSTAQHDIQITHSNSFFAQKFGRNDFEKLNANEIKNGNALDYLTKYLYKTNEKIIYSRGIPTEIYKFIDEKDIAVEYYDFVTKFVLFDNVIDIDKDIMHFKYKQSTLFEFLHKRMIT